MKFSSHKTFVIKVTSDLIECLDRTWYNTDSTKQIDLQEYLTGTFKEMEKSGDYKFLSTFTPTHKKKKLHASLVLNILHIQLYHFSVDIVCLVSDDPNTLSIFIKMLKSNTKYNPKESRKSNITQICKELKRNKKNPKTTAT